MKKRFRIITSLILVTLLVTALASPAIAVEVIDHQGSGIKNGYNYNVRIYHTEEYGYAYIATTNGATMLQAEAKNSLYDSINLSYELSDLKTGQGYAAASAMARNTYLYGGRYITADIVETYGNLYVNGALAASNFPPELIN